MDNKIMPSDLPKRTITSPAGTFRGSILKSFSGQLFAAFRGIPYALPPVGPLRFTRPQPHPKIIGEYDASKEGPICIQPIGYDHFKPGQEDCLYLNVFTPAQDGQVATVKQDEKSTSKKVLVFIHGGAFFVGCANQHVPGDFVSQGNVIVVTLNYRLSWLGFVNGPVDELKGNMGMWDQLMALKWVKNNIYSFGGDPDDITLSGQSMGGEMVSALSISPFGQGLFTKGVLMSGTMFTSTCTNGSSNFLLNKLAEILGLEMPQPGDHATLLEMLRKLQEERFRLPIHSFLTGKFTSIDGEFFPRSIQELRKCESYLTKVGFYARDYLVTLTNNEGLCHSQGPFVTEQLPEFSDNNEKSHAKAAGMPTSVYRKVHECYSQPSFESHWPKEDICIEPVVNLPAYEFLETASTKVKSNDVDKRGKSYFLLFDHMPTYYPPAVEGIPHSMDLCYLFDITPDEILRSVYASSTDKGFTEKDKQMKSDFIKIITEFMKYGNPNIPTISAQAGMEWPEYEPDNEYYLRFAGKSEIKQFPMKKRRQLWKDSIPIWKEEAADQK